MNEVLQEFYDNASAEREAAFAAYCDDALTDPKSKEAAELVESFDEAYQGEYENEAEFAKEMLTDIVNIPEEIFSYVDFGAYWNDLRMGGDYWSHLNEDGWFYIFRAI